MSVRLIKGTTETAYTSATLRCSAGPTAEAPSTRLVQVAIGGTATVQIQGRVNNDMAWESIATAITASGVAEVAAYPEIRVTVASNNDAVSVAVNAMPYDKIVPVITSAGTASQDEDIADSVTIYTCTALSAGALVFSMHSNPDDLFEVNESTGVVSLADGMALDYENASSIVFQVKATDSDTGTYAIDTVTLTVGNVLDASIVFTSATSVSADEDVADSVTIYTATATKDAAATIAWSITADADNLFEIHSSTGVVSLQGGKSLDYDTATSHEITIEADDSTTTAVELVLTINVNGVSEVAPTFTSGSAFTWSEDTVDTRVLVDVNATPDVPTDTVTYSITVDADDLFRIESSTGRVHLQVGKQFDYETKTSHAFTVSATDGTNAATQVITITVGNVFDFSVPIFTSSTTATAVDEDIADTDVIYTAVGVSTDYATTVTYSITGDVDELFEIDEDSGEVTLRTGESLDYDTATSHEIEISGYDGYGTGTITVTIPVNDVA